MRGLLLNQAIFMVATMCVWSITIKSFSVIEQGWQYIAGGFCESMTSTRDWRRVLGVLCTGPGVELALSVRPSLSLPLIMFDHAFHASLTKPNLCTNSSHNHPQCALSIATFTGKVLWTLRVATLFHMYYVKCNIFGLIGHIWPLRTIICMYICMYLYISVLMFWF